MRYVIARGVAGVLGMVAIESRRTPEGGAMASRGMEEEENERDGVFMVAAVLQHTERWAMGLMGNLGKMGYLIGF